MKNRFILSLGVLMVFFYTCSKDSDLLTGPTDDAGLKCAHDKVFVVRPSGGDDSQALLDAFEDAKAAGKGSVVQLVSGTYVIKYVKVNDFYGSLLGAGSNKTIITCLPESVPCDQIWQDNEFTALLKFLNGDVTIANMKFVLPDGKPCAFGPLNESDYAGDLFTILLLADWGSTHKPAGSNMNAKIKNVEFEGGSDGGYGTWWHTDHNALMGIWYGPDVLWTDASFTWGKGNCTIDNCTFTYMLDGAEASGTGFNSGTSILNSTFVNNYGQIYASTMFGSRILIRNNHFTGGEMSDVWVDDMYLTGDPPPDRTTLDISGNTFDSPENAMSVFLTDVGRITYTNDAYAMLLKISNNTFFNRSGGYGIFAGNSKDLKIWNNRFKGSGQAGIRLDGDAASGIFALNASMMANNFREADYVGPDIFLGPFTKGCKIAGVPSDEVEDLGVDNKVIGVKAHKNGPHTMAQPEMIQKRSEMILRLKGLQPR